MGPIRSGILSLATVTRGLWSATVGYTDSKHWFTTSFLGGWCRKAMFGVCRLHWRLSDRRSSFTDHCYVMTLLIKLRQKPGRPVLTVWLVGCCFTSTETLWLIRDGAQDGHLRVSPDWRRLALTGTVAALNDNCSVSWSLAAMTMALHGMTGWAGGLCGRLLDTVWIMTWLVLPHPTGNPTLRARPNCIVESRKSGHSVVQPISGSGFIHCRDHFGHVCRMELGDRNASKTCA